MSAAPAQSLSQCSSPIKLLTTDETSYAEACKNAYTLPGSVTCANTPVQLCYMGNDLVCATTCDTSQGMVGFQNSPPGLTLPQCMAMGFWDGQQWNQPLDVNNGCISSDSGVSFPDGGNVYSNN